MSSLKKFFKGPLAAGLAGGFVVGLLGWVAIAAGWISSDSGSPSTAVAAAPALSQPAAAGDALTAGQIYQRGSPAIAYVEAEKTGTSSTTGLVPSNGGTATGSGFLIDDQGTVLTNDHVVEGSDSVTVKLGAEGDTLDAKVVGADPSSDVAVLRVDPGKVDAAPLKLADSDQSRVGDAVVAIGNPFGLDLTVTTGIVSALQREITAPDGFTISDVIQTDAAVNPGNSGGPLLNSAGEVIGINSQIATGGGQGSVGVGFAVPINTAADVSGQILDGGEVEHAFVGIGGAGLTPELADLLNLDTDAGVLIQDVTPDSPAAKAGLKAGNATIDIGGNEVRAGGDIITAVDGQEVAEMEEVAAAVNSYKPGDTITLQVVRNGETRDVDVTLGDRPAQAGD